MPGALVAQEPPAEEPPAEERERLAEEPPLPPPAHEPPAEEQPELPEASQAGKPPAEKKPAKAAGSKGSEGGKAQSSGRKRKIELPEPPLKGQGPLARSLAKKKGLLAESVE